MIEMRVAYVKLQMFIQRAGTGIVMQTSEYAAIPPVLLTGGTTEILSGASLSQYFLAHNNVFSGFDQSREYFHVPLCFQVQHERAFVAIQHSEHRRHALA